MDEPKNVASNIIDPFPLARVVMPLIRVMRVAHISWADRVEIANAIHECHRAHKSLMDEHEFHRQSAMGAQQKVRTTDG